MHVLQQKWRQWITVWKILHQWVNHSPLLLPPVFFWTRTKGQRWWGYFGIFETWYFERKQKGKQAQLQQMQTQWGYCWLLQSSLQEDISLSLWSWKPDAQSVLWCIQLFLHKTSACSKCGCQGAWSEGNMHNLPWRSYSPSEFWCSLGSLLQETVLVSPHLHAKTCS